MGKVRRRYPKDTSTDAYQRALRHFALVCADASIEELEFLAEDDLVHRSILLDVRQRAKNEAVKYPPYHLEVTI